MVYHRVPTLKVAHNVVTTSKSCYGVGTILIKNGKISSEIRANVRYMHVLPGLSFLVMRDCCIYVTGSLRNQGICIIPGLLGV